MVDLGKLFLTEVFQLTGAERLGKFRRHCFPDPCCLRQWLPTSQKKQYPSEWNASFKVVLPTLDPKLTRFPNLTAMHRKYSRQRRMLIKSIRTGSAKAGTKELRQDKNPRFFFNSNKTRWQQKRERQTGSLSTQRILGELSVEHRLDPH